MKYLNRLEGLDKFLRELEQENRGAGSAVDSRLIKRIPEMEGIIESDLCESCLRVSVLLFY